MNLRQQLNRRRADKIPPGFFSVEALAKREGFSSVGSMRLLLCAALKNRLLEVRHFTVPWGDGIRKRAYYRYKKKG